MTDDDAFIRAIVAAPGDEAPRLVYADWLDERGDPHGLYLRAEVEAFRQNRGGPAFAAAEASLRGQALGLDPMWVARVSRPPVGVCCDRITFTHPGPALSVAELEAAILRLGTDLALEYRAFLLNQNGGAPTPNHVRPRPTGDEGDPEAADDESVDQGEAEYVEVGRLFSAHPPGELSAESRPDDLEHMGRVLKGFEDNAIGEYLPIARGESDDYFLLGIIGGRWGSVAYFPDYTHNSDARQNIIPVADSFARFLARIGNLDPDWVRLIHTGEETGFLEWLAAGGDPNAVDDQTGESVLQMAADEKMWGAVAELLRRGVDLPGRLRKQLERHGPASIRQMARDRRR